MNPIIYRASICVWKIFYSNHSFICGSCSDTIWSNPKKLSCYEIIVPNWIFAGVYCVSKYIPNISIPSGWQREFEIEKVLRVWNMIQSRKFSILKNHINRASDIRRTEAEPYTAIAFVWIRMQLTDLPCLLRRIYFQLLNRRPKSIPATFSFANYRNRSWKYQHVMMGARKCCSPLHFLRHTKSALNKLAGMRRTQRRWSCLNCNWFLFRLLLRCRPSILIPVPTISFIKLRWCRTAEDFLKPRDSPLAAVKLPATPVFFSFRSFRYEEFFGHFGIWNIFRPVEATTVLCFEAK